MSGQPIYRFAEFCLDVSTASLTSSLSGQSVSLTKQALVIMHHLIDHRHRIVSRDELCRECWTDAPPAYANDIIAQGVRKIRGHLGDKPQAPRFIQTIHGHGYRFIYNAVEIEGNGQFALNTAEHQEINTLQALFSGGIGKTSNLLPDETSTLSSALARTFTLGARRGFGSPEFIEAHQHVLALLEQTPDISRQFKIGVVAIMSALMQGKPVMARRYADISRKLAEELQDSEGLLDAEIQTAAVLFFAGDFPHALSRLYQGIPAQAQNARPMGGYLADSRTIALCYMAQVQHVMGFIDQALDSARSGYDRAESLDHAYSMVYACFFNAWLHQQRREYDDVIKCADRAMAIIDEPEHIQLWHTGLNILKHWALIMRGSMADLTSLRNAISQWKLSGGVLSMPRWQCLLAEACGCMGLEAEGLEAIEQALILLECSKDRHYEVDIHIMKGELLLRNASCLASQEDAAVSFQRALSVARHQSAKFLEMKALSRLGQLRQEQKKRDETWQALAGICQLIDDRREVPISNVSLSVTHTGCEFIDSGFPNPFDLMQAKILLSEYYLGIRPRSSDRLLSATQDNYRTRLSE